MKPSENRVLEPSLPREAYWDDGFFGREQRGDLLGSVVLRRPRRRAGRRRRLSRRRHRGRERHRDPRSRRLTRASELLPPPRQPAALRRGRRARRHPLSVPCLGVCIDGELVASPFVRGAGRAAGVAASPSGRRRGVGRLSLRAPFTGARRRTLAAQLGRFRERLRALSAGASWRRRVRYVTRSRRIGKCCSRTTTSAITAPACIPSSAA